MSLLDVLTNYAWNFYFIGSGLAHVLAHTHFKMGRPGSTLLDDDIIDRITEALGKIREWCVEVGLDISIKSIDRFLALPRERWTLDEINERIKALQGRIEDELDSVLFLHLSKGKADYYDKPSLFGQVVTDNFSDAAYDISEAGSCYATERHTACVMHLMRALEVSLKAVGIGVGVPNAVELARNSWGVALKAIGEQIGANDKAKDPAWTPEKSSFFKDVRAHLFAVKVAWRDNAMHLEKKYDEADAKRIFDAAKNFMEHLAEHLDQAGNFTT